MSLISLADLATKALSAHAPSCWSLSLHVPHHSPLHRFVTPPLHTTVPPCHPACQRTPCRASPQEPVEGERAHSAESAASHLWQPDALASTCDNFYCRVRFSVLERRHVRALLLPLCAKTHLASQHCRKCGGVFCRRCTSKLTHLLDVSNLDFLHPPRHVPISAFDSPTSPVSLEKVCDDCWDQIYGAPRTPDTRPSTPMLTTSPSSTASPSPTSSICASPIEQSTLLARSSSRLSTRQLPFPSVMITAPSDLDPPPSLGELGAYPLRCSSIICKATGGGRWEPKNSPPRIGLRIPGRKAPYELEMEREDAEERRRRMNPIVRDGGGSLHSNMVTRTQFIFAEFQYRFRQDRIPPASICRTPCRLSTF